ncbi:MAG TPA: hypothetical protein VHP33_33615 [Polyangiaceae bacterium]|nr:hypothetical protein [Polyangiaceae bacterium]
MSRRLIDLTESDLEAIIVRRLVVMLDELRAEPAPTLLDRQGLARALSCSTKTLDRLRGEPNFPELQLFDAPRFELSEVLRWVHARNGAQGLRVVGGTK